MAFTKINAAGIGTTETVTVDGLTVINDGSFGGNLTVSGVLTYEDVTNVDSVGLITARNGIVVGSGITLSKDGDGFFTGIVTATSFSGSGANLTDVDVVSDTSPQLGGNLDVNTKNIVFGDSGGASDDRLTFGAGTDLSVYHSGSHSFIQHSGTGHLILGGVPNGNNVDIMKAGYSEYMARFKPDSSVDLYYDANVKFQTTSSGVSVTGAITATGTIETTGSELKITGAEPRLTFTDTDNNPDFQIWANAQKFAIYDSTNSTTRIHIDSSGRVIIGDTDTDNAFSGGDSLVIGNTSSGTRSGITLVSANDQDGGIYFSDGTSSGSANVQGQIVYDHSNSFLRLYTAASERVRIDSDGRVGIKNTNMSSFNDGMDDLVIGNGTNGTSPGMTIYSNSSDIGSISFRDSADTGISGLIQYRHMESPPYMRFVVENSNIAKLTTSGLCFGSDTAAANALDDYEEGTYTPVFTAGTSGITYSTQTGNYVKIGKLVRFDFYIQVNGGVSNGNMIEFNLPMSSAAGTNNHRGSGVITYHNINNGNSGSNDFPALYIGTNSAQCYMGPTQWQAPSGTAQSNRYFIGGGTYHAA